MIENENTMKGHSIEHFQQISQFFQSFNSITIMYTNTNYKPFASQITLTKSKSTDNFYRKAAQKSLRHLTTMPPSESDCLACKHERQTSFGGTIMQPLPVGTTKTLRKNANQEYYKTNDGDELVHVKKSKRYLEQLLDKTKIQFKKSVELYQKRLNELNDELKVKNEIIFELKKMQNKKQAEQNYLANASLVQTYQQANRKSQDEDLTKNRQIKELVQRTQDLEDQLASVYQVAAQRLNKMQAMQLQMVKMQHQTACAGEFEAMKGLIDKMQEEKLRSLDRQHSQLQQFQKTNNENKAALEAKVEELRSLLQTKTNQLTSTQIQLQNLKNNIHNYKNQQYQTLRDLLDQRQKQCIELQSRLNCIQAQMNYVKGRYGYILRMAQHGQLIQSRINDPEEVLLERVGRFQVSNGKESILGMNLSPIKPRQIGGKIY